MKNWRTAVGALCIIVAMMLGAFAGITYARDAGVVSASQDTGTRGEDRTVVSALDPSHPLSDTDVQTLASHRATPGSFANVASKDIVTPDGTVEGKRVTAEDMKTMMRDITKHTVTTKDGSITVEPTNPSETRGRFPPGTIEAGGPYLANEGNFITFTVKSNDPTVIAFRWDFNDDGVFDFPSQVGAGPMGRWTTLKSISWGFFHPFYGNVQVQGWDLVSTTVKINTGNNLGESTQFDASLYPLNRGYRFTAKVDMILTDLGNYPWFYGPYGGFSLRIWDFNSQVELGKCTPVQDVNVWNWCSVSPRVSLIHGHEYLISGHKSVNFYPYWVAQNTPPNPPNINFFSSTPGYYNDQTPDTFPATPSGNAFIPQIDFKWETTTLVPDAAAASAILDIENVAPVVTDINTTPNPGLEGSPAQLSAQFSDPGLNSTWQYRFQLTTPSGLQTTPWTTVQQFNGGAKVLWLHTFTGDIDTILPAVQAKCGNFCVKTDAFDWGPGGQNKVPPLSYLLKYDVVVVGVNFFVFTGTEPMGDRLAEYMDAGGNVVMMQGAFDSAFGCIAGICGRWDDEKYSPIPRDSIFGPSGTMGTIYVPGHPLLDGVSSINTAALAGNNFVTNPGAIRIVDWNNGRVLAATNTNPKVSNGARAVALNFFPITGFVSGDWAQMAANAIRWASRQPDPTQKPMPIALEPVSFTFADDAPTTTPRDDYQVIAEVRDDSDGAIQVRSQTQLSFDDFNTVSQCNGNWPGPSAFPPGWTSDAPGGYNAPDNGFQCNFDATMSRRGPTIYWYYNDPNYGTGDGESFLTTGTYDMSPYFAVRFSWYNYWEGRGFPGPSDGIVEASVDGGASYTITLAEYHHFNPAFDHATHTIDNFDLAGQANVVFRFRYESNDDWMWGIDDVRVTGLVGVIMSGLGRAVGSITIANVPPTIAGGFNSALRAEAQSLLFKGFKISDPALTQPTEWFAYKLGFDDGSPSAWVYKGTLAPPRLKVFVVHTACLGPINGPCLLQGGGFGDPEALKAALLQMDDVASVDMWNFINYPLLPEAPTLSLMMQYDVIIVATNWAYGNFAPFNLARRQVGDRLADYIDSGRGGAFTMMCVYCLAGGNDLFSIRGRYITDQYGPFKQANYLFPGASSINILAPDHDAFVGVGTDVGSSFIHDGKDPVTVGKDGGHNAAGRDGELLATWDDGATAVGAKVLNNGMQTAHLGGWHVPSGADAPMLFRNLLGIGGGGLPSPKIPAFTHTWGDNGIYTVDMTVIDDDMGFVWDTAANAPVQVLTGQGTGFAHKFVTVAVDNVDPTIMTSTIQAFIATSVCLRVSGTPGNTVALTIWTDGTLSMSLSVTRAPGSPNATVKCGLLKVDVLAPHTFVSRLNYAQPNGGSNPTRLIFSPWRNPVTAGHGTLSYSFDLKAPGTTTQPLQNLKLRLLGHGDDDDHHGEGAVIDFAAESFDPGTDDVAFLWSWSLLGVGGGNAPIAPKSFGPLPDGHQDQGSSLFSLHVYHNDGSAMTNGVLGPPDQLGFTEPYFNRPANTGRSAAGATNFRVRDSVSHGFNLQCGDDDHVGIGPRDGGGDEGCGGDGNGGCGDDDGTGISPRDDDDDDAGCGPLVFYVLLLVLDDDNLRGYDSHFTPHDGTDMAFILVDLR